MGTRDLIHSEPCKFEDMELPSQFDNWAQIYRGITQFGRSNAPGSWKIIVPVYGKKDINTVSFKISDIKEKVLQEVLTPPESDFTLPELHLILREMQDLNVKEYMGGIRDSIIDKVQNRIIKLRDGR